MKELPISETLESPKPKAEAHETMGGKINIYRCEKGDTWQCSTFLNGRNWRVSTHEDSLGRAKDFAEDWYLGLRGKAHAGLLPKETRRQGKKFKEAAAKFLEEAPILTQGRHGPTWLKQYELKLSGIILSFLGEKRLAEITSGLIQEYRIWRAQNCKTGKTPTRSTVHKEIVCIRLVLKTAGRHGWMEYMLDMSVPYKTSGTVTHRAWFSPEEYKKLYQASRRRAREPKQKRFKWECEQLHDCVLFAVNTGLRPDEAMRLQFGDVTVVKEEGRGQIILEIEARGKRGVGYCKSTEGAVRPFERLQGRRRPDGERGRSGRGKESVVEEKWLVPGSTDLLFPKWPRD
jgi:integrase